MVIPLPKLPASDLPGVTPVVAAFVVAGVVVLAGRRGRGDPLPPGAARRAAGVRPAPRGYVLAVVTPVLRVLALGCVAWGLTVLLTLPPKSHRAGEIKESEYRHLVLVLDVSREHERGGRRPGRQAEARRARRRPDPVVLRARPGRAVQDDDRRGRQLEAKPVVLDTTDREVIRNILTELPMRHAFKAGETNMFAGLEEAAKIAKPWAPE